MHRAALLLVAVTACAGEPVGEAGETGGSSGTAGSSGSAGAAGAGGTAASGGSAGSSGAAGSGGSAGSAGASGSGGALVPGDEGGAEGLAIDAESVYFGRGKDVLRVAKTGGPVTPVAQGTTLVRDIVVVGGDVVFLDGEKILRRAPTTGGSASLVAQGGGGTERWGDIATDGTDVFFTVTLDQTSFAGAVMRVPPSGGVPAVVHQMQNAVDPQGLALFGGDVYWANHIGKTVMRASAAGGGAAWLANSLDEPWRIAVNSTHIYYTDRIGGLYFFEPDGALVEQVPSDAPGEDVVLDAANAYWTTPTTGKVYAAAIGQKLSNVLLTGASLPGALAVDADALYVACSGGVPGAVVRIPK
jgi:hypothetical protein